MKSKKTETNKQIKIKPIAKRYKYFEVDLVGIKFALKSKKEFQKAMIQTEVGCRLKLIHEPTNKYDPNAIAVYFKGVKLGYISKNNNKKILAIAQKGHTINAVLTTDMIHHYLHMGNIGNKIMCMY